MCGQLMNWGDVTLYLIEGDEKALLIDTGYGAGNLKDVVQCQRGGYHAFGLS